MVTWLKQLGWRLSRFIWWVFRDRDLRNCWFTLLPILVVLLIYWFVPLKRPERVLLIRNAGLFLQLMGIGTVAYGLYKTRKLFGRPSLGAFFRELRERVPKLRSETRTTIGTLNASLDDAQLTGYATLSPSPTASLEERVVALEQQLNQANVHIYEIHQQIKEESQNRNNTLASERQAREAVDDRIERRLEENAIGGIHLEIMGIVWLSIGTIFTTIPKGFWN